MKKKLDNFGENFIKSVRDNTLFDFDLIVDGKMKSQRAILLHEQIAKLDNEQVELLKFIIKTFVDKALFNSLFFFEEGDWQISNPSKKIENLSDLSDGLSGELYTEDGWIAKFSKYEKSL